MTEYHDSLDKLVKNIRWPSDMRYIKGNVTSPKWTSLLPGSCNRLEKNISEMEI